MKSELPGWRAKPNSPARLVFGDPLMRVLLTIFRAEAEIEFEHRHHGA